MNASNSPHLALPKPEPRTRTKGRKDRAEATVVRQVRRQVFARDIGCRVWAVDDEGPIIRIPSMECCGRLTLAHLRKRSATRGMPSDERHQPETCVVLCAWHHVLEETHRLRWAYLTDARADGAMSWVLTR